MDENQAKSLFKIEDIADDLIKLYAARESEKDMLLDLMTPTKRIRKCLPYSETDDQLRSAAEIKRDMEKKTNGSTTRR